VVGNCNAGDYLNDLLIEALGRTVCDKALSK
jgi:hypothetical protein